MAGKHPRILYCSLPLNLFLAFLFLLSQTFAYPSGAPSSVCSSMNPDEIGHGGPPQNSKPPYFFTISSDTYSPGKSLNVTLQGCNNFDFTGFLLEAREEGNTATAVGQFTSIPPNTQHVNCDNAEGGVTHTDKSPKTSLSFVWTLSANSTWSNDIAFYATIVRGPASIYWTKHKSFVLKANGGSGIPVMQICPSGHIPTVKPTNSENKISSNMKIVIYGTIVSALYFTLF